MLDVWQQSYFFLSPCPLPLHLRLTCPSLEDDRDAVVFTALADSLGPEVPLAQDLVCAPAVWSEETPGGHPQGRPISDDQKLFMNVLYICGIVTVIQHSSFLLASN